MTTDHAYPERFNDSIRELYKDALRLSTGSLEMMAFVGRAAAWHNRAGRVRACWQAQGVPVPATVIYSVTKRCNLHCKGCYFRAQEREPEPELNDAELLRVADEAHELGVSIMMLAGGEPLTRPVLFELAARHPQIVMPVFTNGLLIDDEMIARFRANRNLIPVISLEGHAGETDDRRGAGVHAYLLGILAKLRAAGLFFGASLTVTQRNYDLLTSPAYVQELVDLGSRLFFYVEYVPIEANTAHNCLDDAQKAELPARLHALRGSMPGLFVALPGEENLFGGCLAAGRGFVHISAEGRLEPCPFAPYSDVSLRRLSLREALQSDFLREIRESDVHLSETEGGCALWAHRDWVLSLLRERKVVV
jgi:MoaA/NifB/PqqE/SkfB family radical SAM enzyme